MKDVPLNFLDSGDIICHVPQYFLFKFWLWRDSKSESDVWHVLFEELFMLDVRHSQIDAETILFGITDSDIFINSSFDEMILAFCKFL